jgi:hypothetical protein
LSECDHDGASGGAVCGHRRDEIAFKERSDGKEGNKGGRTRSEKQVNGGERIKEKYRREEKVKVLTDVKVRIEQ